MSTHENSLMVIGSEAQRLKLFLLANKLPMQRSFHRAAGTDRDPSEDRVAKNMLVDALQSAMLAAHNPGMAVDFGSSIRPIDMGIYGMVILTAPSISEALERSVKYSRLMTDSGTVSLERCSRSVKWVWNSIEPLTVGTRVRNEVVLTEHVAVVRALRPCAVPRRVSLMHSEPGDSSRYHQFFRCPIDWCAGENSVEWSMEVASIALDTDASIGTFIEKEAARRLALLPASDLLSTVTQAIVRRLRHGDVNLPTIAAQLGRAPRSLRRQLSDAGFGYRSLVDSIRRNRARELACDTQYSMTDISLQLGFSEVSAFSRAWRRWFNAPFRAKTKSLV
jgi:AraC-like DNA-binding protein